MSETLVFVGCYSDSKSEGIKILTFDTDYGAFSILNGVNGIENPSFLVLSADGQYLYSVSEVDNFEGTNCGAVASYMLEENGERLKLLNMQSSMGSGPCQLSLNHNGSHLFVANYGSGSIAMYALMEDGSLAPCSDFHQHTGNSVNPERQEGPHAHMIRTTPDDRFALAADLGTDQLLIYRIDYGVHKLIPQSELNFNVEAGQGPRHFEFHLQRLFLINELGNTLMSFEYEPQQGRISGPIQTLETLPKGFRGLNTTADIHIHPNGRFLYGSNRGHDSLIVCSLEAEDQILEVLAHVPSEGKNPRNFGIDQSGKWLLAANQDSCSLQSFSVDQTSGMLTPAYQLEIRERPVCVQFGTA